jgi:hypothetical protein
MTWRERYTPIIAAVLRRTKDQPEAEIKKALHDAWPDGVREYYPYATWLDEIRRQRGLKRPKVKTHNGRLLVIDEKLQDKMF